MRRLHIFVFLLFPLLGMAQHPSYWELNHEQGLPSLKVYDLMQDSLGVMWIGTSEGLVHYDGLWLHTLRADGALAPDRSMVKQDPTGVVWSMNFAGQLFCSDYERMWADTLISPYMTDRVIDIQQEGDSLLFLTRNELILYRAKKSLIEVIHRGAGTGYIYGACGARYIHSSDGIERLATGQLVYTDRQPTYNLCSTPTGDYCFFHITGRVTRLVGNEQQTVASNLIRSAGSPPRINGVRTTSAGTWILTYDGVYLVEEKRWFFPSEPISDVVEANDGSTWISTLTDGVRIIPNLHLKRFGKDPDGLSTERLNHVRALPNGNMVVSDNSGTLALIHPEHGPLATFKADNARESEALEIDTVNNRVLAAFGDLYLLDADLKLLDKLNGDVKSIAIGKNGITLVDARNIVKVAYNGNAFGARETADKPPTHVHFQTFSDALSRTWVISNAGTEVDGTPIGLTPTIRSGAASPNGLVFLSNRQDSIAVLDGTTLQHWLLIPSELSRGMTVKVIHATDQHLFVLLSNSLLAYSFRSSAWQRFASSDGLPSTDLRDVVHATDRAWLASFNGLYALPIDEEQVELAPTVLLRRMKINGKERKADRRLELEYSENDLELLMRGISTHSRGRIQFMYQLKGLMDDFELNQMGSVIRFRALPPGNYELNVLAIDANGNVSNQPFVLAFIIRKPWYGTWPFYLLVAMVLIALVSIIFLFRIRYINQRNSQELERSRLMEDLRSSQMTALRAQMNPHFMFNVLNSIQGLFTIGRAEKANEVLSRFSDLMRSILDVSDQNTIGLDKELELIGLYLELEAVRFGDEFTYQLNVEPDVEPEKLEVPSLLIQPYVENAVKHGLLHRRGQKKLDVSIGTDDEQTMLIVAIEDNGVGREKAASLRKKGHRSFATEASSSRLDLLNTENERKIGVDIIDKMDDAGNATGTLVRLRIPIVLAADGYIS